MFDNKPDWRTIEDISEVDYKRVLQISEYLIRKQGLLSRKQISLDGYDHNVYLLSGDLINGINIRQDGELVLNFNFNPDGSYEVNYNPNNKIDISKTLQIIVDLIN